MNADFIVPEPTDKSHEPTGVRFDRWKFKIEEGLGEVHGRNDRWRVQCDESGTVSRSIIKAAAGRNDDLPDQGKAVAIAGNENGWTI